MGEQKVKTGLHDKGRAEFIKHLLSDIDALELMLEKGLIEDDIVRIGSEQEFCLVTRHWRPSNKAEEILSAINDPHFTTELALFNLEINLDPIELKGDCFEKVESQLKNLLQKAAEAAKEYDAKVLLTGILPTISKKELEFHYMTPHQRYWALNDMLKELRGDDFTLHIKGVDDLTLIHDSVLFEACNTSFQMHLQVPPHDFISSFNWAQAISGPILGISTNSPLLLGRELWHETRVALFQQSIDTRHSSYALKNQQARVSFGTDWEKGSIAEIFKNDVAQHEVILSREIETNSLEMIKNGHIPKLHALNIHNGTIYKWNRPCYGVGGGKPHIRIENRHIPSGPTTLDEMATFAFWVGLMMGRPKKFDDMPSVMDFREAKANFIKAARTGKYSVLSWMGRPISVKDLILIELLPIAYQGLEKMGIDKGSIQKYLRIIENRARGITGSQWIITNYRKLNQIMKKDDALRMLTKALYQNQESGKPVNDWPSVPIENDLAKSSHLVGHIMSTQLFTVQENDLANLAVRIMQWKNIHHVPVKNQDNEISGILTWTHMKRHEAEPAENSLKTVEEIMEKNVTTVVPETPISEAIGIMKQNEFGCLPVVREKELVGIITIKDVIQFDHGATV
ncbi:CBS domain-containing protein [Aureisphaera galaxeae]|uniref:CBS domain-containing protein n=1 Tax=Aureisphaera galaxeae TaxID=1538023 RepID=UPI0023508401|nr:CBS domain-containing protein [Aureisphaera galaxeae]MDC8006334.1 CBS domain-containing protein [Aureisphaera galaxeae]